MTDELPLSGETTLEVTDPAHVQALGLWQGLRIACDILSQVEPAKRAPGFEYALALIQREEAALNSEQILKNLVALAAVGADIASFGNLQIRGRTLIFTPLDQTEGG